MKYSPSDIKPIEIIARERGFEPDHAIDGFGKAEYEWIATRMVQESQNAGNWIYIGSFGEPFPSKSNCLNSMRMMHADGWLDKKRGMWRYRLNTHSIEKIAKSFSK